MDTSLKLLVILLMFKLARGLPAPERSIIGPLDYSNNNPEIFLKPHLMAGRMLKDWAKSKKKGNPEEQGNYFEGDILIDSEARNGIILTSQKWKDGKIPFEIRGSFSPQQKNMLSDAIEMFKKHTCIRFVPRGGETDFVVFENGDTGCWSGVGKTGGEQVINLQTPGCMSKVGTVVHEILHSVGFFHEQNRSDRDTFVRVNFQNIPEDKFVNFEKGSSDSITSFGVPYDVDSVLHYSAYAFSKNNQKTIEARRDNSLNEKMGQRDGFSKGDIAKINAMYCKGKIRK